MGGFFVRVVILLFLCFLPLHPVQQLHLAAVELRPLHHLDDVLPITVVSLQPKLQAAAKATACGPPAAPENAGRARGYTPRRLCKAAGNSPPGPKTFPTSGLLSAGHSGSRPERWS